MRRLWVFFNTAILLSTGETRHLATKPENIKYDKEIKKMYSEVKSRRSGDYSRHAAAMCVSDSFRIWKQYSVEGVAIFVGYKWAVATR